MTQHELTPYGVMTVDEYVSFVWREREQEQVRANLRRLLAWRDRYEQQIGFRPNGTKTSVVAHRLGCNSRYE